MQTENYRLFMLLFDCEKPFEIIMLSTIRPSTIFVVQNFHQTLMSS